MSFPSEKKYVKISLYLNKLDDISNEQFTNYWRTNHVKLAMKNKTFTDRVRRYNQVRLPVSVANSLDNVE